MDGDLGERAANEQMVSGFLRRDVSDLDSRKPQEKKGKGKREKGDSMVRLRKQGELRKRFHTLSKQL